MRKHRNEMIKSATTIAEKSLFITAIAFFALIIAVMTDIPDAVFIGILLIAMTLSAITVHLIKKENEESETIKIQNLQDIADIINSDVDNGAKEIKEYLRSLDRDKLEGLAFRMAILASMVPEFLEPEQDDE